MRAWQKFAEERAAVFVVIAGKGNIKKKIA
jgi:hypothetical protein